MDLDQAIKSAGRTQRDLAKQFGVSEATMSRWINGGNAVPVRMIRPLAEALSVPVEVLLTHAEACSR